LSVEVDHFVGLSFSDDNHFRLTHLDLNDDQTENAITGRGVDNKEKVLDHEEWQLLTNRSPGPNVGSTKRFARGEEEGSWNRAFNVPTFE